MLAYPTLLLPFIAWLLMGYLRTVPKELEEQAMIDGASRFRAMTRVILPLCMPGFISAGIFAFTLVQNEFLYALFFLSRSSVRTVPIGVAGELIRGTPSTCRPRPDGGEAPGSHAVARSPALQPADPPAASRARSARRGRPCPRDPDPFTGGAQIEPHPPGEPGGAGAKARVPSPLCVELPVQL